MSQYAASMTDLPQEHKLYFAIDLRKGYTEKNNRAYEHG